MELRFDKEYVLPCYVCDNTSLISLDGIVDLFMDMATEHASKMNLGMDELALKGCFWVISKTKLVIKRRPRILEKVTLSTWPQKPSTIRYNRFYGISDGEGFIVEGKSEWTILDKETFKPIRSSQVYPQDIIHSEKTICDVPFCRLPNDFSDSQVLRTYKVSSTDIDMSQHMNNVAYIRAMLGSLSTREIEDMNVRELEIAYKVQCFEGEEVTVRRMDVEGGTDLAVVKSDGTTASVMRLIFG